MMNSVVCPFVRFLSTPSARRATGAVQGRDLRPDISIHALREEGDERKFTLSFSSEISIHALREEGDIAQAAFNGTLKLFLSTPSARRATGGGQFYATTDQFLSTPSARRATAGDVPGGEVLDQFLSTPSARRATEGRHSSQQRISISIHALREEGPVWSSLAKGSFSKILAS